MEKTFITCMRVTQPNWKSFLISFLLFFTFNNSVYSQCDTLLAYTGVETTGNQNYTERLGMIFTVNQSIVVTSLGAFDSDQDGLNAPITVGIIDVVSDLTVAGPIILSGTSDPLVGNHRLRSITPVVLPPGQYVVVAVGYGAAEANGNVTIGDLPTTTNTNGGLITFDLASYGGIGFGEPSIPYTPQANVFHAGTFDFAINDITPPIIGCPAGITVSASHGIDSITTDCGAIVGNLTPEGASDNCGISTITYSYSGPTSGSGAPDASGTYLYVGSTTIEYTVTDYAGNTGTCVFNVLVYDDVLPTITCPQNVTIDNTPDSCNAPYNYIVNYADNCSGLMVNGFTADFTPANWTLTNTNAGDGTVMTGGAPDSIVLISSNNGSNTPSNTDYCITIPGIYAGMLTFDWNYTTLDNDGPFWDQFHYVINGTPTTVVSGGPTDQSGNVLLNLNVGDEFCFRMYSVDQLFGSAITISMDFMYNESINPDLTQTGGLPSGDLFPVGNTTNTFVVTDNNDNTATCSFTVTVSDVQDPTIVCPADIEVDLVPLACDSLIIFDAVAADNCPGVTYEVTSPLESGDLFPIGETTVIYTATDAAGNTATCSFEVVVNDYFNASIGCLNRNVSLDENCQAIADPTMLLTGYLSPTGDTLLGCLDSFEINFIAPNGTLLGNVLDGTYLGKTLNYSVVNDLHSFRCWGTVKVEDKFPPSILCLNDTIACIAPISSAIRPEIIDNCGGGKVEMVGEVVSNLECDTLFLSRITREWIAVDAYGNKSAPCTQNIYIKRTKVSGIAWPRPITISCKSFTTAYPPISMTGVPTFEGHPLHPLNQTVICNGFSVFNDIDYINADCKRIIQRTWEVGEWWCNSTNIQTWVQLIEVKDDEGPVIGDLTPMSVSTNTGSCKALVNLPAAKVTDNCNTYSVHVSTGEGVLNSNGGLAELSVGAHTVTYTATDLCGNQSTKTMRVLVTDLIEPIALCHTKVVVSLKEDGTAWLYDTSVDNGSFDECGDVDLKIRRMTSTCDTMSTAWVDAVGICCADVGKEVMVGLLVTDEGGNTNQCMVTVEVQDKRIATITCPLNVTVSCTTGYDDQDLGATFGEAEIGGGGCSSNASITELLTGELNSCRLGILERSFTLRQNGIVVGGCKQTVTFIAERPFNENMIVYPRDTTFVNGRCNPLDLSPESLPLKYGKPQLEGEGVCDLVASSYTDDVYSFNGNGACYKIVRHWTVINWCYRESGKIWQDSFDQVLVVMNNTKPTITSNTLKREVCSYNVDCTPVAIKLDASATDDCTPTSELKWRWEITLANGVKRNGTGRDASGTYAFGLHHIDWEVEDKCGNISYTSYDFEVKSCKAPTAYCKQGLSTELVGMDTDNNGTLDTEMSILKPSFFDNGSSHTCGNAIKLSFSANVNDTILSVSCPQKNKNVPVQLWVTDHNGNTAYCTTFVNVQDNNNVDICPATSPTEGQINGKVLMADGRGVKGVAIELISTDERNTLTDGEGKYAFADVPLEMNYNVKPKKSDDVMNGVSTLDLVMIQRHILGAQKLTDPYKILAADVNKDGKITASDLVQLRKLILGSETKMVDDESWRFLAEGQTFADPGNPMTSQLVHTYDISKLEGDMTINFTGLKVGDVNGNVVANAGDNSENRSHKDFNLYFMDKAIKIGERTVIAIKAAQSYNLQGLQMSLNMDGLSILNMIGQEISNDHLFHKGNGIYNISIAQKGGKKIAEHEQVFEIEVEALKAGMISEMIELTTDGLTAEAYIDQRDDIANIQLQSRSNTEQINFDVAQNIPNPWQNTTIVPVTMPEKGTLMYSIKDNNGRTILTRSQVLEKGINRIELNKNTLNIGNGSFIFEAVFKEESKVIQMIKVD